MGNRLFASAVAVGLVALTALATHLATAPRRLRQRAQAGGLAHVQFVETAAR